MAKSPTDYVTPDLFDGRTSVPPRRMPIDVRRRDMRAVPVEVADEICGWCGVDRAGGCGACSDLRVVER